MEMSTMSYPVTIQRKPTDMTLFKWCLHNVVESIYSTNEEKDAAIKAIQADGAISTLLSTSTLPVSQLAGVLFDYHLGIDSGNVIRLYPVMLADNRTCEVQRRTIDGQDYIGVDLSHIDELPLENGITFIVIDDENAEQMLGKIPWSIEVRFTERTIADTVCSFRTPKYRYDLEKRLIN